MIILNLMKKGGKTSAFMANSAQGITNAAKNLELGDKLAQLFRQKMVMYIALVALLIVVLGATYYYLSPYHTFVRTMMSETRKTRATRTRTTASGTPLYFVAAVDSAIYTSPSRTKFVFVDESSTASTSGQ